MRVWLGGRASWPEKPKSWGLAVVHAAAKGARSARIVTVPNPDPCVDAGRAARSRLVGQSVVSNLVAWVAAMMAGFREDK